MRRFDELRTRRMLMRRWTSADVEVMAALNADPDVMEFFAVMPDRRATEEGIVRWEARFEAHGYGLWALERLEDGVMLGMTGLNPVPTAVGVHGMEVGWRLARHAWGFGYATEAANAALEVARESGLPEIWSFTAALNARSQAVMRHIGLTFLRAFDHPDLPVGHPLRPHVLFHTAL